MSFLRNSPCAPNQRRTERGSAVITVLVLAAVTAVIASSFLFRAAQEAKLATRSLFQPVALNLAEAGIEEGIYALNTQTVTSANGWSLATGSTTDYVKTITSGFDFTQATGAIYIRIDNAAALAPTVLAAGHLTVPNQRPVVKQLRVNVAARRLWGNGLVAKETITFTGSAIVNSFDSAVGAYNAATNRGDRATVASASSAVSAVVLGSTASIYGYVATGGSDPSVGATGRIYGATSPATPLVDASRVRRDFNVNLPDAVAPTGTSIALGNYTVSGTTIVTLPRVGDTAAPDGRYRYSATGLTITNSASITVTGPVDIIIAGNLRTANAAYLAVSSAGTPQPTLNVYCSGTIDVGGAGMINNTNVPASMTLYGTAPTGTTQIVNIANAGTFVGAIYAPNGNVTLANGSGVSGAVIAKTATLSGTAQFHYDVQLINKTSGSDYVTPNSWCELTSVAGGGGAFARDNRAPFTSLF